MAQPVAYNPTYVFTDWQTAHPSDPLPADSLDVQLNKLSTFSQQVCNSLALIQRDDGALANNVVTIDSLASSLAVLMGLDKYVIRGTWITATAYSVGDVISTTTGTYVCATAHTSGVFATDYAAGKWLLLASTGASTAASFIPTGSSTPANGMYLPASNTVGFAANSLDVLRLSAVASAQNYFKMQNSAASDPLQIQAIGLASNLDIQLVPKGIGRVLAPELILATPLALAQGGVGSATASGARTNLGLGTSAVIDTGTSGAKVPLLNTANIWSAQQDLSGTTTLVATAAVGDSSTKAASTAFVAAIGMLTNTQLAKTAAYTVVNADKGKTITLGGSAFYTLTVSAIAGYDPNFAVRIVNEDTGRCKRISPNGLTSFLLWPGQTCEIYAGSAAWQVNPKFQRWGATTTPTFYIDKTNGLDTNDGMATGAGNALLTIQQAVNYIRNFVDCQNIAVPIIQLKSGDVQTEQVTAFGPLVDNVQFMIQGDTSATPANWANYLWNVSAGNTAIQARDYGTVTVKGVKFVALGIGATALSASQFGTIDFQWVDFGAFVSGTHMTAFQMGAINALATYQISGNLTNHATAINNGCITLGPGTVTLPNALTWPADFLLCNGGQINLAPITFSGAGSGAGSTGRKYQVAANGVLFLSGNTIPGATAGITATGGQVI